MFMFSFLFAPVSLQLQLSHAYFSCKINVDNWKLTDYTLGGFGFEKIYILGCNFFKK